MVSHVRILVRKKRLSARLYKCFARLLSAFSANLQVSAEGKSQCVLLAGSLLPVVHAGLGAFQRQVPGGHRQAGPADVEDEAPLRPQQEQRLRGAGGEEPAGHLGPLQGLPHRPRGGQEKSVQQALNSLLHALPLSFSLNSKVVVTFKTKQLSSVEIVLVLVVLRGFWKSSAEGLETLRCC